MIRTTFMAAALAVIAALSATAARAEYPERNITMTHVPYNGGTPSLTAAMSGEVQVTIADTAAALPLVRDGRLVALASTAAHRPQVAPEIPTIDESGYPGVAIEAWAGLLAPHGT